MELQRNEQLYKDIVGQNQRPLITHMSHGVHSMNKFVTSLVEERRPELPEPVVIERYLTPHIENALREFQNMQKFAMEMKRATDACTEKLVYDCKSISDDLRNTERKQSQTVIEMNGKKEEINEAKKQLEQKEDSLSTARRTLSNSESELEKRKDNQKIVAATGLGISSAAIPAMFIPGAGPLIAAGLYIGGTATATVSITAMEKAIQEQRSAVSNCNNEVQSCKTQLNNAEEDKNKLNQHLEELERSHNSLQRMMNDTSKQIEGLKRLQIELADWHESLGKCVHSLTLFYGRVKVLHHEVVGGYMIDVLMKPTQDICSSFLSLMECRGFRHVCGTEDNSNMINMTQKMERKLIMAIENKSSAGIEDLV